MYKMSALSSRRLWRLCRSLLHIGLLVLSLPDLAQTQFAPGAATMSRFGAQLADRAKKPGQPGFLSQDSFGSPITVFNMTTISPPIDFETATKVSAETIDAILGALDNAAQTIENAQISTSDISWTPTTQRIPVTPEEGFTIVPPHAVGGEHGGGNGDDHEGGGDGGSDGGIDDGDDKNEQPNLSMMISFSLKTLAKAMLSPLWQSMTAPAKMQRSLRQRSST